MPQRIASQCIVVCSASAEDGDVGQVRGGQLASKVMALPDSGDLDSLSPPVAMFTSLCGDFLIDFSMLSNLEQIGEGGFATVYRAELRHRNGMKQTVAVKKLRPERVTCDEDLREFIAVLLLTMTLHPPHQFSCAQTVLHALIQKMYRKEIYGESSKARMWSS